MNKDFYKAFEDKFRGSRTLIKKRLEFYLPFIEVLIDISPNNFAVDLGCGRGEWLELLNSKGFNAIGVDIDESMLSVAKDLELTVKNIDAIDYLTSLKDNSISLISAFHLIEHIKFDDIFKIISEVKRVLIPGGLLILETPNPENIIVSTYNFYIDPTHNKPIHPELLEFICEYNDYGKIKRVGLQESSKISKNKTISVCDLLFGVSPDYAVIAQKKCDFKISSLFENIFLAKYGVSLYDLILKYEKQNSLEFIENLISREQSVSDKNQKLVDDIEILKAKVLSLDSECLNFSVELNESEQLIIKYKEKIRELLSSNHELYTWNEEIAISNKELSSTIEEMVTKKQEIIDEKNQIVLHNKHLITINEKLLSDLSSIYFSKGWRLLHLYYELSAKIIPHKSKRRRAVAFIYKRVKLICIIFNKIKLKCIYKKMATKSKKHDIEKRNDVSYIDKKVSSFAIILRRNVFFKKIAIRFLRPFPNVKSKIKKRLLDLPTSELNGDYNEIEVFKNKIETNYSDCKTISTDAYRNWESQKRIV